MKTCLGTVHLLPVHGSMKWQKPLQSAPSRCRSDKEAASPSGGLEGTDVDGEAGSGGPWQSGPGPILHLIRKHMQGHETYASPATRRSLTDAQHMEQKGRKRPDAGLWNSQRTPRHHSEGVKDGGTRRRRRFYSNSFCSVWTWVRQKKTLAPPWTRTFSSCAQTKRAFNFIIYHTNNMKS